MLPKVQVDPAEFLRVVEQGGTLVIRGPKVFWQGVMYVAHVGDYYYYTFATEPLPLPSGLEIRNALAVVF